MTSGPTVNGILGPIRWAKARLDHRQATGCQKGPADPLHEPRHNQQLGVRGNRTEQRGDREQPGAEHEDATPSIPVAKRPTEKDQRGERQRVAVEDPLQGAGRRVQVAADVR